MPDEGLPIDWGRSLGSTDPVLEENDDDDPDWGISEGASQPYTLPDC